MLEPLVEFLIVAVMAVVVGYILFRNSLFAADQKVKSAWAGIEVQMKRRHELVPNLIKAVSAAMRHEQAIIDKVVEARRAAAQSLETHDLERVQKAEAELSASLRSFFAYAEHTPEITATTNIRTLQQQLEEAEDQIAAARRIYNGNVEAYNTRILSIPWNFIAKRHDFQARPMLQLDAGERDAVYRPVEVSL